MPRLIVLAAGATASLLAYGAHGQEPDPNVSVAARPRPDYDPLGIRAGGFLIFPSTSVAGSYTDNVFATEDDTDDDFFFNFLPGLRRPLELSAARDRLDDPGQHRTLRQRDRRELRGFRHCPEGPPRHHSQQSADRRCQLRPEHESRDDPEDPGADVTDEPLKYYDYGGSLGFEQDFNRLNFGLLGDVERRDYTDGDESDRDRNLFGGRLRTGYFISPRINAFLQGGFRREVRDDEDTNRDNNVYSAGVGSEIDFTGLLFGEAFAGWSLQEFDDDEFDSENGFTYGANLTWNPTRLTSLRLEGQGGFEPSDVGSSRLESEIGLRVDHELLRNVLIGAEVSYQRDDFQDADRIDNRIDVGPDITYLLNRYLSVGAGYTFTTRESDDSDREFDRNLVTLRVTAQL